MQTTSRVLVTRAPLVALLAAVVLLGLPGTGVAAGVSVGSAPIVAAGHEPLARGAGYGSPKDAQRVRSLQRTLRRLGWSPGPVDGLFGPLTEAAVVRFQRAAGLVVDGIAGSNTARALRRAAPRPLRVGDGYDKPEGSPRVRSLQARLRRVGLRPGPVDGRFGPRTQAALMRLQAAAGAPLRGVVDARTRRLLENAGSILRDGRRGPDAAGRGSGGRRQDPSPRRDPARAEPRRQPERATRPGRASGRDAGRRPDAAAPVAVSDQRGRATAASGDGSTGLSVPLLLAAAALAALAGALLAGVGAAAGASVPLAPGVAAAGRARERSVGSFRGRVQALVLARRGLVSRPAARYLVGDRHKPGPVSVGHGEVAGPAAAGAAGQAGHANGGPAQQAVRAVGYATVPRTEQPNGPLVQEQAAAIDALCERRGWRLLELVRDVEEPRVKGLDRPGLGYALERVASGEASCVVVSQLRRLSPSASDLGRILESIAADGGRLVAMDVDVDTALPAGRKAANVLIAVGAWERERVGQRTRKGLEAARAKGNRIGRPAVDDVPELKQRIAAMRASGMTLQAIADRLNAEGVPTLRGGERWRPSSVQAAVGYRRPPRRWQNGGAAQGGGRPRS